MKIYENGKYREATKAEIAEFQKECEVRSTETIEDLRTQAVEMQGQLSDLLERINRLESEVQADE